MDWAQIEAEERGRSLLIDEDFSWSEPPARRRFTADEARRPARQQPERERLERSTVTEPRARDRERERSADRDQPRRGAGGRGQSDAWRPERPLSRGVAADAGRAAGVEGRAGAAPFTPELEREASRELEGQLGGGFAYGEIVGQPLRDPAPVAGSRHAQLAAERPVVDLDRELGQAWGGRLSAPAQAQTLELEPYAVREAAVATPDGRRTVVITGRGSGTYPVRRRRDVALSLHERAGLRPDRTAMWAVLLGLALLIGSVAH